MRGILVVYGTAGRCLKPEMEDGVRNGQLNIHIAIPAPQTIINGLDLVITIIAAILTTMRTGLGATLPIAIHDGGLVMWVAYLQIAQKY